MLGGESPPSGEGKGSLWKVLTPMQSGEQEKRGPLTGGLDALPVGRYATWSQGRALPLSWRPGGGAAGEGLSIAWMTLSDPPHALSRDLVFS